METWKKEDLLEEWKAIGRRWVFVRKKDEHGKIVKYKAHLVAQGFSQKPGTNYLDNSTFAPMMHFKTLRTMLANSAIYNWKLRQFDVKGAYLHRELKEEIYIMQAPGYEDNTNKIYYLFRSLYGLKQAGNVWNTKLNNTLTILGFNQLKSNYCCYIQRTKEGCTILLIWVNNFLLVSDQDELNDQIKTELNKHFKVKSLGQPSIIIGVKVHQENHLIKISQTHYIDTLLKKYGLQDVNPVSTPMDPSIKLDVLEGKASEDNIDQLSINHGYANLIRSLMYLAIATQPNIAYLVNKLTQYISAPKTKHWTAIKRIIRYLKGTRQFKLTYGGSPELLHDKINIYCDADWASDSDQKSISSYVIIIAGGAIAWSSKKQNTVAPSTPKAKYIAATHVAKQVLWHQSLLTKLKFPLLTPSIIFFG